MYLSEITFDLILGKGYGLDHYSSSLKTQNSGDLCFMTGCMLIRSAGWLLAQSDQHVVAKGVGYMFFTGSDHMAGRFTMSEKDTKC